MRLPIALLSLIVFLTLVGPELAHFSPYETHPDDSLLPPGEPYALGTDLLGRDVLSRVLHGGRRTLLISVVATGLTVTIGGLLGIGAGALQGISDRLLVTILNALLSVPTFVVALVILSVTGNSIWHLAISLGIAQIAPYAHVVRGSTLEVKARPFIVGAQAAGAGKLRIIWWHILPNVAPIALSYAGIIFGYSILNEAALSFLGLGGEPGIPDWGAMMNEGRAILHIAPLVTLVPGSLIVVTVYSVNAISERISQMRHSLKAFI